MSEVLVKFCMKTFKTCKNEENDLESYCDHIIITIVLT